MNSAYQAAKLMQQLIALDRIADRRPMRAVRLSPARRAWNHLTGKRRR